MPQLDENRSAGPAEAALLREQLALDAKDDAELETRLLKARIAQHAADMALLAAQEAADSAGAYSARIREQRDHVAQRISRARGLLHPVRRVPDELLSHIFLFMLDDLRPNLDSYDYDRSLRTAPFTCAAVCRRWRVAALSTPKLWSCLAFNIRPLAAAMAPAWNIYLGMFYYHSKNAKLSIFLTSTDPTATSMRAALHDTLKMLLGRCTRLHVSFRFTSADREIRGFSKFAGSALNSLRELTLSTPSSPTAEPCCIANLPAMPRLRSLTLDNIWLSWDQQAEFPTLQTAFLRPAREIFPAELATAAAKMPSVSKFAIVEVHFEPSPPTVVPLPHVKVFELQVDGSTLGVSFDLPVVVTASIALYGDSELEEDAARRLATAGIQHLLERSLARPSLETLSLYPTYDVEPRLADALKPLTGLRDLTLGKCSSLHVGFLQRLSVAGPDNLWICPYLENLHLGLQEFDEDVLVAVSQLVHARCPPDGPRAAPAKHLQQLGLVWNSPPPNWRLAEIKAELSPLVALTLWNQFIIGRSRVAL